MSKPMKSIMSGKGYYIALGLCAAAIGISGYLYHGAQQTPEQKGKDPAAIQAAKPTEGDQVQAVATRPGEPPEVTPEPSKALKTACPVDGEAVAEFAVDCLSYNETTRDWRTHNGVDLAAEAGTQVSAAADGKVYTVYEDETMGHTVVIRHQDGYTTQYASLAAEIPVEPGQMVKLGEKIGTVGTSALLESALGDHVHFSVTCNNEIMDPMEFLNLE